MGIVQEIERIIRKYGINKIFCWNKKFIDGYEVYENIKKIIYDCVEIFHDDCIYSIYGGGTFGQEMLSILQERNVTVEYIIDNKVRNEIGMVKVVTQNEWMNINNSNCVIIASYNYHDEIVKSLEQAGYSNKIIDMTAYITNICPMYKIPFFDYKTIEKYWRLSYSEINKLELDYTKVHTDKKYELLRQLIFALLCKRDFLYAEKYIEELREGYFDEFEKYSAAITEIKKVLVEKLKKAGKDSILINIVDSLSNECVDSMKWLSSYSQRGIRFRGITTQYPYTEYAINAAFTGKCVFDMEMTSKKISEDTMLIRFLYDNGYEVNIASCCQYTRNMFESVNMNKKNYPYISITESLFEAVCLYEKRQDKNFIVIHSSSEIHSPFYSVGAGVPLISMENMSGEKELVRQKARGVEYADEELEWYYPFFDLSHMPIVTMGDHGVSTKNELEYFFGSRKDMPRITKECISRAFMINNVGSTQNVDSLIANTDIPQIFMMLLKGEINDWSNLYRTHIELQQVPGYDATYCKKFMSKGIFGNYEGCIGIRTANEIYLLYATGKEIYQRPEEYGCENLIDYIEYKEDIEKIKRLLVHSFPMEIYKMDKYKVHMNLLKQYDYQGYLSIMNKLEKS